MESYFGEQEQTMVVEQQEKTAELKVQQKSEFNFELMKKEVIFLNLLVLSKPEKTRLKYAETRCLQGEHTLKAIELFTIQSKECPLHKSELAKTANHSLIEVYTFYAQASDGSKLTIFVPSDKLNIKLDIYNRINVRGFDSDIKGKGNGVYGIGIFVDPKISKLSSVPKQIEMYEEVVSNQKSMLTKEDVIEQFGIDIPRLNLSNEAFSAYKHGLLLPTIHSGINCLTIGNPGSFKSSIGLEMKELSNGAYVDSTLATGAGIIGSATRDYQGHHLEGGIIFAARNEKGKSGKVLVLDELDKMVMSNSFFLKPLNGILANHHLSYHKANIAFDDEFNTSFIGFGNPIYGRFQGVPYNEIMQTFRNEKTFISRMHLIFALRCSNPDPTTVREYDMNSLKVYLNQARNIKVTEKDITPEAKAEMQKLYAQNINDERFYSKLKDLCIAEAKFSLHSKVELSDVLEIEKILKIAKEMLYARN